MRNIPIILAAIIWALLPGFAFSNPYFAILARKRAALSDPGGFSYTSTVFGGSAYMLRGGGLTGISDGQTGTVSLWVKMDASSSNTAYYNWITGGNYYFNIGRINTGAIQIRMSNSTPTTILTLTSGANSCINSTGWIHVLAAWDMSVASKSYLYVDGVDVTVRGTHTTGQTCDYTWTDWGIGSGHTGGGPHYGLLSELWFSTDYYDITNSTVREDFRTAGGAPEDISALGTPVIYLPNPYTDFNTNAGTGGNFTITGTLTDGGADKP